MRFFLNFASAISQSVPTPRTVPCSGSMLRNGVAGQCWGQGMDHHHLCLSIVQQTSTHRCKPGRPLQMLQVLVRQGMWNQGAVGAHAPPQSRHERPITILRSLPLVSTEWKNGSNSSYNCTPFLHSLLTKGKDPDHVANSGQNPNKHRSQSGTGLKSDRLF